ncbi:MAG: hypothetical protein MK077_09260 [Phycisphaerales bacterium]|nr:hypothetical protein [Phycisphaerales bacterium]
MKRILMMASGFALATSTAGMADVLQFESFESYETGSQYEDTGDSAIDHWLENNDGQAIVDGDTWSSWYTSNGGVGLTDGDWVGVTSYTGSTGGFTDGDQAFQWTDVDGEVDMIFDAVAGATTITLDLFILSTGYEGSNPVDFLSVSAGSWDGGLYIEGDDLEGYGYWMQLTLTGSSDAELVISLSNNSGSEGIYIDNIVWSGDAIPAPGALALLGLAGLAGRRRRR